MDAKSRWLSQLAERTLTVDHYDSGVTNVTPPHDTGWRTLPGMVTAHLTGYDAVLSRDGHPDVRIHAGQTFCVPQGQHHRIALVGSAGGVSRWSHLAFRLLGGVDVFTILNPPLVFTGPVARHIGKINEMLCALHARDEAPLHSVVKRKAFALDLLSALLEHSTVREDRLQSGETAQRFSKVLEMMSGDLAHPPEVGQMARACSLSVSRFQATFKSIIGVPPRRYLLDLQLLRAQHLLFAGDLPVKSVAMESGFRDVFHFSRLFHKRCGISPSAYRAQARQGLWSDTPTK